MANHIPWPRTLAGMRCLDVGTMDGFWAFEMERRGANEVLAIDLGDPARRDLPVGMRRGSVRGVPADRAAPFRLAAELLDSRATWQDLSVYDLSEAHVGQFDLVFLGYTLNQLRDPVAALEAIRGVCRGAVIVLDEVSVLLSFLHRQPVARLAPRPGFQEWWVFNTAGVRRALELAGFRPEAESRFLQYRRGAGIKRSDVALATRVRYGLGLAGVSLAIRAIPSRLPPER